MWTEHGSILITKVVSREDEGEVAVPFTRTSVLPEGATLDAGAPGNATEASKQQLEQTILKMMEPTKASLEQRLEKHCDETKLDMSTLNQTTDIKLEGIKTDQQTALNVVKEDCRRMRDAPKETQDEQKLLKAKLLILQEGIKTVQTSSGKQVERVDFKIDALFQEMHDNFRALGNNEPDTQSPDRKKQKGGKQQQTRANTPQMHAGAGMPATPGAHNADSDNVPMRE